MNAAPLPTGVLVVFVGQPGAAVEHPGPVQWPVFEIEPDADADTFTSNDTDTDAFTGTPAPIVHVIVEPDTDTAHVAADVEPHAGEPDTRVVPAGTVSVTVTGAADADVPVFVAVSV